MYSAFFIAAWFYQYFRNDYRQICGSDKVMPWVVLDVPS